MFGQNVLHLLFLSSYTWLVVFTQQDGANDNKTQYPYQKMPCREGWDPSPCFCEGKKIPQYMECENLTSTEQLVGIFQQLKDPLHMDEFGLQNSQVTSLPAGVFGKAHFKSMAFYENDLESIDPAAFHGMEDKLASLSFSGNKIEQLDFIHTMKKLNEISINNDNFAILADRAFANIPSEERSAIYILQSSVSSIGNYAFADYSGWFMMKRNKVPITKIGDYAFYTEDKQTGPHIFFNDVQILNTALSPKTFAGSRIAAIEFRNTSLSTLDEAVFLPLVENIKKYDRPIVEVTGNPVKCDQSIKWIVANYTLKNLFHFECENGKKSMDLTEDDLTSS